MHVMLDQRKFVLLLGCMESVPEDVDLVASVREFRDDFRQEVAASAVDAARPPDPPGPHACSSGRNV